MKRLLMWYRNLLPENSFEDELVAPRPVHVSQEMEASQDCSQSNTQSAKGLKTKQIIRGFS
jgi:hypothetical protein